MEPLVTCCVYARNAGNSIEAAVRSVLDQSGIPGGLVETVVVDDGSSDQTRAILASFGDRITVIEQPHDGPAMATNRALNRARGSYIALLDACDTWVPDKLARQLPLFGRPEVGLVHGDVEVVDADGRRLYPSKFAWRLEAPASGRALGRLLARNETTSSAIVMRADLAKAAPPMPVWAGVRDWWLSTHVAATHQVDVADGIVARCLLRPDDEPPPPPETTEPGAPAASTEAAPPEPPDAATIARWERELRVYRLLLRELDLADAGLDELAVAGERFAEMLRRIAEARGVDETAVVKVTGADRAIAAGMRGQARTLLSSDPGAAARVTVHAMAADPFDRASAELFEQARGLRTASGQMAGSPAFG